MSRIARFFEALKPTLSAESGRLWVGGTSIVASSSFWLIVIVLLTLVLYGPGLTAWFVTDDFIFLRAARYIGPLGYIKEAFDFTGYDRHQQVIDFLRDDDIALPFLAYRPLYFTSLEGMYLVFGDNPAGYHAVSLIVHLANTLLVWLIASRLLKAKLGAHIAAMIFALHPAYVAAVAWISDMATPLATFMVLLSLLFFMKSMDRDPPHRGWYIGSIGCYGASMFFHLGTISWLAAFVAFFILLNQAHRNPGFALKSWPILLPFAALAAASYGLHSWILAHTPVHEGEYHAGPHMLTQFKNLASAALFPVTSDHGAAHLAAFVVLLLMMATLPAMAYLRRRNVALPRAELFVILWFLASLAPLLTGDIDYFFRIGVLNRKLYPAGPALAIFLVMYGTALLSLPPRRLQPHARTLLALLLVPALVGGLMLARDNGEEVSVRAGESERFVQALREAYPSLPEGSTLYVVGAPRTLTAFGDIYLLSSIQAFYGRVDAYGVTEERAALLEQSLDEGDHVFRYSTNPE